MIKKWRNVLVIASLAVSIALILWITLFSRLGSDSSHFYPPFWSYRAILNGSEKALLEDIGNVILFIPIGVLIALFFRLDVKRCLLIGFSLSLLIESCQWFLWLGSFEIDDLLHNTIGAGVGSALVTRTVLGTKLKLKNRKKSLFALLCLIVLIISSGFAYQGLKWQEMKRLAALNDREDGTKNLLILSPDPKYLGETDFSIVYQSDGSVLIEGSSENRAWIEIGRLTTEPGSYSFSGLSGVEEKTVAIELEYYDANQENYIRLTPDVGPIDEALFSLEITTKLRALIGVYPEAEGEYIARPVIYREGI